MWLFFGQFFVDYFRSYWVRAAVSITIDSFSGIEKYVRLDTARVLNGYCVLNAKMFFGRPLPFQRKTYLVEHTEADGEDWFWVFRIVHFFFENDWRFWPERFHLFAHHRSESDPRCASVYPERARESLAAIGRGAAAIIEKKEIKDSEMKRQ